MHPNPTVNKEEGKVHLYPCPIAIKEIRGVSIVCIKKLMSKRYQNPTLKEELREPPLHPNPSQIKKVENGVLFHI